MANIAAAFREEVTRLARQEARTQLEGVRKASLRFANDIAQLKRDAAALLSRVSLLSDRDGKPPIVGARRSTTDLRFQAKGLATHRKRLRISAANYGKLAGVTGQTIYSWEQGRSKPRKSQLTALAAVRKLGVREARARLARKPQKTKKR